MSPCLVQRKKGGNRPKAYAILTVYGSVVFSVIGYSVGRMRKFILSTDDNEIDCRVIFDNTQ